MSALRVGVEMNGALHVTITLWLRLTSQGNMMVFNQYAVFFGLVYCLVWDVIGFDMILL